MHAPAKKPPTAVSSPPKPTSPPNRPKPFPNTPPLSVLHTRMEAISASTEFSGFSWWFPYTIFLTGFLIFISYIYYWFRTHNITLTFVLSTFLTQMLCCCDILQRSDQWTPEKNEARARKLQDRIDKVVMDRLWRGLVVPEEGIKVVDEQALEYLQEEMRKRSSVVESVVSSGGPVRGKGKKLKGKRIFQVAFLVHGLSYQ